jgi:hypothetical protein
MPIDEALRARRGRTFGQASVDRLLHGRGRPAAVLSFVACMKRGGGTTPSKTKNFTKN